MSKILGGKLSIVGMIGLITLISLIFFGVAKIVDSFFPERPNYSNRALELNEVMEITAARQKSRDSIYIATIRNLKDSLSIYRKESEEAQKNLLIFYKEQNDREKKYNIIRNASNQQLMDLWAKRYGSSY